MFDIGLWEVALILVLALIVIGPERLPQVARTVGHWIGRARKYIEGVKSEVEKEFDTAELKRILHNQEVQIRELQGKINRPHDFTANTHKYSNNTIEPPSEPQYEIIEETRQAEQKPQSDDHVNDRSANDATKTSPAPEKDKPA